MVSVKLEFRFEFIHKNIRGGRHWQKTN